MVIAAALIITPWHLMDSGLDRRTLGWERYWRRAYFQLGWTLPGTPDLAGLDNRLGVARLEKGAPVLVRVFKAEFELELWLMRDGAFHHFATYPICRFSGQLGPKLRTGDHQSPEGFYTVDTAALNPNSRWHRSFNLGFPNAFDAAHGRTGSFLMVHGGCSSVGCYAMTNPAMDEIWRLVTASLAAGQERFQVQVFPFHMSRANMERYAGHPDAAFWRQLQPGYELFEAEHRPPRVIICNREYVFETALPATSDGNAPLVAECGGERKEARPPGS